MRPMTVADLLPALHDLKAGRLSIDQLIAACTELSSDPNRPLAKLLAAPSDVPLATEADDPDATTDHVPQGPNDPALPPAKALGGQYVPIGLHARGGMGQVWLARDPLGREVAFKELRLERAGDPRAKGRFVREAMLTGQLEHPGVVPVYTAGTKTDGGPFYAMRLIRGRTLTDAIRDAHTGGAEFTSLPFRDLLNSFVAVCNAIAFAHSKGIIHRDLKPSNVMVGDFGEVQVMDWGLAKEMSNAECRMPNAENPDVRYSAFDIRHSDGTQAGVVLGTPAYMAPEQASGETEHHDERTDVFGLGAILYEILTCKAPFASHRDDRGTPAPPRRLNSNVPAALEAICLKAISARPGARYSSAQALAADVRHWLADEAVTARRDPFPIRATRWMRRHRTFVSTAAAVLIVATIGLGAGLGAVTRVNNKLDSTNEKLKTANDGLETSNSQLKTANTNLEEARKTAEARKTQAEHARDQTGRVLELVVKVLGPKDAEQGSFRNRLIEAAQEINRDQSLEPPGRIRLLNAIGLTFSELGRPDDFLKAIKLSANLARRLPDKDPLALMTQNIFAIALLQTGDVRGALDLLGELTKGFRDNKDRDDSDALVFANNLAQALVEAGAGAQAVPLMEEVVRRRKANGAEEQLILMSMSNLGNAYHRARRFADAVAILKDAHQRIVKLLGPDSMDSLIVASNLGVALDAAGDRPAAIRLLEDSMTRMKDKFADDPRTFVTMSNLAESYAKAKRNDDAAALFKETLQRQQRAPGLGPKHPDTMITTENFGVFLLRAGRPGEALPLLNDYLAYARKRFGNRSAETTDALAFLTECHLRLGNPAAAESLVRECVRTRKETAPEDWPYFAATSLLGEVLLARKKPDEAEPLLKAGYEGLKSREESIPPEFRHHVADAAGRLAQLYDALGQKDKAAEWKKVEEREREKS
jgi:eukaryotic-like serine/threonine-protein kinase